MELRSPFPFGFPEKSTKGIAELQPFPFGFPEKGNDSAKTPANQYFCPTLGADSHRPGAEVRGAPQAEAGESTRLS